MVRGGRFLAVVLAAGLSLAAVACVRQTPPTSNERYVSLGDSYTSGPLIPLPIADAQTPTGCMQSDHNYPHVIAPHLAVPLVDASCSGATTDHMTNTQNTSAGRNAPQFDRLTTQTKVVTLGIGGNDIGFASIAATCAGGGLRDPNGTPCQDAYVVNGDDKISDAIAAMAPKLGAVLDGIHARSPQAKVFVVGYPAILPDTGAGCYPVMPITPDDVPYLREKEKELNATIRSVTNTHGDVFVDTYTPSIGHDACQAIGTKWIEPVTPTEPGAPVHPNARGEQGIADAVIAAMNANGVPTT